MAGNYACPRLPEKDAVAHVGTEAICAAYGSGLDDMAGLDARRAGLEGGDRIGQLLYRLVPNEPELARDCLLSCFTAR